MRITRSCYPMAVAKFICVAALILGCGCNVAPVQSQAPSHSRATSEPRSAGDLPTDELSTLDPRLSDARSAVLNRRFAEALRFAKSARSTGAPEASILQLESAVFKSTDYLDREITSLERWKEVAPADPRPWLKLFYVYLDLGWMHEADLASEHLLTHAPSNSRSYVARALYFYRSDTPELAINYIETARRLDPSNISLMDLHESILLKTRRYAAAEEIARGILAKTPKNVAQRLILAHALIGENKVSDAETLLRSILQDEPSNVEAAYELGAILQKHNDVEGAAQQFEKVVALDRSFNNVLWRLGRIYGQVGRPDEGRQMVTEFERMEKHTAEYETAQSRLRTRPNNPDLHYQLARYHLAAQEHPQAIAELREVIHLRPKDSRARADLKSALTAQGRATEAAQLYGRLSGGQGFHVK